jgi:hypothetical protein
MSAGSTPRNGIISRKCLRLALERGRLTDCHSVRIRRFRAPFGEWLYASTSRKTSISTEPGNICRQACKKACNRGSAAIC